MVRIFYDNDYAQALAWLDAFEKHAPVIAAALDCSYGPPEGRGRELGCTVTVASIREGLAWLDEKDENT